MLLVACADDELMEALGRIGFHNVPQNGHTADLDHGLGSECGLFGNAGAEAACQNDNFHGGSSSCALPERLPDTARFLHIFVHDITFPPVNQGLMLRKKQIPRPKTGDLRLSNMLIGFTQPLDKLEFVGMPPRAMRAFARVIIFPSAARPVRFCSGGLFYITYAVPVEGPKGCGLSTCSP